MTDHYLGLTRLPVDQAELQRIRLALQPKVRHASHRGPLCPGCRGYRAAVRKAESEM